jgi:hypothetical protein
MTAAYPYDQPNWTVNDQKYWCKLVNAYRFPIESVPAVYRSIITDGKSATFEAEYQQYVNAQQ